MYIYIVYESEIGEHDYVTAIYSNLNLAFDHVPEERSEIVEIIEEQDRNGKYEATGNKWIKEYRLYNNGYSFKWGDWETDYK